MLLDMHIPDWDPAFLSEYDPASLADQYARAGVAAVLVYGKSHLGLNSWPAPVGSVHRAARDRDLVAEMLSALRDRDIAAGLYHTTVFDNWAIETHPEWSTVPASTRIGVAAPWHGPRYGTACPNNPDYREYERTQITALLERYDVDVLWLDMTFWNAVCVCVVCSERSRTELGFEIPERLDWRDAEWVAFQAARERWLREFIVFLHETAQRARPRIDVVHNFGAATHGWYSGLRTDFSTIDAFAAGDIYGGRDEQLLVSKIMQHLGQRQPAEFMTTRTSDLANHVDLKSELTMTVEALATIAHNGAFLFIDAIDPRGTVNPEVYERLSRVFAHVEEVEVQLGGTPVADVAIYYSDDSCIYPPDSGRAVAEATIVDGDATRKADLPHIRAVSAAAAALQRAHIPFAVLTHDGLSRIGEYSVLVLPDVIRMSEPERDLVRAFVAGGGRIYASGRTSLLDTTAAPLDDLGLSDVFGVRLEGHESGDGFYLAPRVDWLRDAVAPEHHLSHGFRPGWVGADYADATLGLPRVTATTGRAIATLTLPYAYPSRGSMAGHDFASIHSSPPWEEREEATIVENQFGDGRSIYAVAPVERGRSESEWRVFVGAVERLLGEDARVRATAHPDIWLTAFEQPERSRALIAALVYRTDAPSPQLPLSIEYRLPGGVRATRVSRAVDGTPLAFSGEGGVVRIETTVELFELVAVDYAIG
ncbi:alpha-L-fucosidase [Salinibacterium metalliresistens]|uniref:alpha-L-fucosidase n=1 Tax=Salinibacterium metalliresistens TaxID=3031321 RepID=UPI0023DCDD9F|nr:alpha-L-fucosidase [Salinibacterium metalliresistens]